MRPAAASSARGLSVRGGAHRPMHRALPEEVPVALVFDGSTLAVMMASPADLADFALGFALSEGVIGTPAEVREIELAEHPQGIEARLWLRPDRAGALAARRRTMAGPVGCGLCGIDSLAQALRPVAALPADGIRLTRAEVLGAAEALRARQPLHDVTRATHAAGFLRPAEGMLLVREDVGRHNALDKLIGALARAGIDAAGGAIVVTSRVSVDLVQKCAQVRCPILIAVSAPTALAVRLAGDLGLTLAAHARAGGFDLYAHSARIVEAPDAA